MSAVVVDREPPPQDENTISTIKRVGHSGKSGATRLSGAVCLSDSTGQAAGVGQDPTTAVLGSSLTFSLLQPAADLTAT